MILVVRLREAPRPPFFRLLKVPELVESAAAASSERPGVVVADS